MTKSQIRTIALGFIAGVALAEVFVVFGVLASAPWHVKAAASGLVSPALGIMAAIVTASFVASEDESEPSAPSIPRRPIEVEMRR